MDEHYFASMHNGGMYLFSIQYNQWYRIDSPELSIQTNSAALASGYEMYVGTSGFGLLKAKFLFMPAEDTPRDNSITVGPCPAKDYLRIELPAGTSAAPEIRIVNISGERMPVRVDFDAAGSVATVDCSGLATGIYCCFVGNGASASMEKIIIAR